MNKKLMAIFASMMIALCLVGASYALWSKWLYIDGRIGTDNVDVVFTHVSNLDEPGGISRDPKCPEQGGGRWDKDVGWTTVDGINEETINITLHNVYPCYYNDLEIEYTNVGSVPVKIQSITFTANFTLASACCKDDGEVWVEFVDGVGSQIEPGQKGASSLKIHVEQPAEQGTDYGFTATILFVQWNEYVP
jgi:hypothetical protein